MALSRRRDQCQPPIAGVPPHSSLIVEASVRLPRHWFQWGNQFAENRFHRLGPLTSLLGWSARGRMMFDPYGAVLSSPRSRLTCQRGDQVMGWCKPAQSGSSIGAMGGTRKGSSGPASHLNAPGRSTAGAYPRAGTRKRSSTLDLIDWEHRSSAKSADAIVEGRTVGLYI